MKKAKARLGAEAGAINAYKKTAAMRQFLNFKACLLSVVGLGLAQRVELLHELVEGRFVLGKAHDNAHEAKIGLVDILGDIEVLFGSFGLHSLHGADGADGHRNGKNDCDSTNDDSADALAAELAGLKAEKNGDEAKDDGDAAAYDTGRKREKQGCKNTEDTKDNAKNGMSVAGRVAHLFFLQIYKIWHLYHLQVPNN